MTDIVKFIFKPATNVNFKVENDELIVRFDPTKASYTTSDNAEAARDAGGKDGLPQGASELAMVMPHGKVDTQGNLLNPDGSVFTLPEDHNPLPTDFGDGDIESQIGKL